jgi:hypothetical protein
MKVVNVVCMSNYKPPHGWRIVTINQLTGGSYEVRLEPLSWYL